MNHLLIEENANLTDSGVFVGFLVMKELIKKDRLSIFELYDVLKNKIHNFNYQNVMDGLVFLKESGLIDFRKPYIYRVK